MSESVRTGGIEQRASPRIQLRTEVRISYPDRESLVTSFCRNISIGGMFVETDQPPAVATVIRFELELRHFRELVRGVGQVMWVMPNPGASDPAGFGMRFLEIDPQQRQLIYRIVDRFIQGGGEPFDLETVR